MLLEWIASACFGCKSDPRCFLVCLFSAKPGMVGTLPMHQGERERYLLGDYNLLTDRRDRKPEEINSERKTEFMNEHFT